ncbi:MAG: hypothetical protein K0Q93_2153 [Nocardioidaceae bacterium]|jgi:hypothetical protein|nr:hypothetical protein [Nocardioidaceae bacterium]
MRLRRRCSARHHTYYRVRCRLDREHTGRHRFGALHVGHLVIDVDAVLPLRTVPPATP